VTFNHDEAGELRPSRQVTVSQVELLEVCRKVKKEDRPKLVADLQVLYENETLPAERWLRHLMDRCDTTMLMPLMNAWQQLKWWWKCPPNQ
jgi:hypothetical protein